jgi:glycosyltransferase involved in cell wall biosynthesis
MRILHVVASLDPRYGGPSIVVPRTCSALAARGHHVELLTTDRGRGNGLVEQDASTQVAVSRHAVHWPRTWATSTGLAHWMLRRVRGFDVVHIHNLYLFHTWWVARCCRRARVPYVISPHGTLDPWHLAHHRRRKAVYSLLVEGRALRGAAAMHYTSPEELAYAARHLGPRPPGFVVPPGVDRPPVRRLADDGGLSARHPELAGRTLVCFLGRLTAKKRLDLLVEAFAEVAAADSVAHLAVAGPDDEGVGAAVRERVADLGLDGRVSFLGLVTGAAKAALLGRSRVLVLASEDESFGVAVAEAMAAAIPVVVSEGVALHREVTAAAAGVVVPLAPTPLAEAMLRFVADPELAARCGANGRALAWMRLSWDQAAAGLERMYQRVVAEPRPATRPSGAPRIPGGPREDPHAAALPACAAGPQPTTGKVTTP